MALRSHLLASAHFWPFAASEHELSELVWGDIPDDSKDPTLPETFEARAVSYRHPERPAVAADVVDGWCALAEAMKKKSSFSTT